MDNVQIRPVIATDLSHLVRIEHACTSDYVWQLDLRKENGQILAGFREVRLPRPIRVSYPRDPFTLADDWTNRSEYALEHKHIQPENRLSGLQSSQSDLSNHQPR